jgi:methyl-accepting chemotaxis protein
MFIGLFDLRGEYLISNNSAYLDSLQIPTIVPQPILNSIQNGYDKKLLFEEYKHEGYTLAYWLFSDIDGHPIAIIAMDYSNADEESKDVKDFLLGVTGSYLVLFFIAAVIAFILSRYITRSLRTIAQRMKSTDLSQNFEPLHWEYQDEIGNLVVEYNKMLSVLKISADQLAEKDRELVIQRFFERKRFAEIAGSIGKSEAACKVQLKRALEKLAILLRSRGVECREHRGGVGRGLG